MTCYREGDLVEIVVRAEVVSHGDGEITLAIPGVDHDTFTLPIVDDNGGQLDAVKVAPDVAAVYAGDVWRVRRTGTLLLATMHERIGETVLTDPGHQSYRVTEALDRFGVLDLVVAEEDQDTRPVMFHLPSPDVQATLRVRDLAADIPAADADLPVYGQTATVRPDPYEAPWTGGPHLHPADQPVLDGELLPRDAAATALLPAVPADPQPEAAAR
jgi:hypothetical protein